MDESQHQAFFRLATLLPRHLVKQAVQGRPPAPGQTDCWTGAAMTVEIGTESSDRPEGRQAFLQSALAGRLFRYEGRLLDASGRALRAFFPARARERGAGPVRERSDAGLVFAAQRAVEAARGILRAARTAWDEEVPVAAGIAVGELHETICEGGGRQALFQSGEPIRAAARLAAAASAGEILLEPSAFRAVEEYAGGEAVEHGVRLSAWRGRVRETRRVPPQMGDYDPALMERAVHALLPMAPGFCREWVLEGRNPGSRRVDGALATLGVEAGETVLGPQDVRSAMRRLISAALEVLSGDEEILEAGGPAAPGGRLRLLLPGGKARSEEIAARVSAGSEDRPAIRAEAEEGTFRLSLEGVDERRWLRVDRLSGERRG